MPLVPPHGPRMDVRHQCVSYCNQLPHWQRVDDIYKGDRAWLEHKPDGTRSVIAKTKSYLPKEFSEDDSQYAARALRSHFSDKFSQAIKDFVGVIFNNGVALEDIPPEITAHWENLDGNGMYGDRLCALIALQVLRRGHSFVMVDFPAMDNSIVSEADMRDSRRHPIWCPISPQQIINWRFQRKGNQQALSMVVIRSKSLVSVGDFGEEEKIYHTVFTPGKFECYEVTEGDRTKPDSISLVPSRSGVMGRYVRGVFTPLKEIPLVCLYGGDRTGFFESNPTLLSLANLNVTHYQVKSDHREKMRHCAFPTPTRIGGDGSDLSIGPRTVVDVAVGGDFKWVEPNARSLEASRDEIRDIEAEMDLLGSDYLVKPGNRQAAQTTLVQAGKIESELYLFASDLALGITECLQRHADYLGLPYGGHAALDAKFFNDLSSDPQLMQVFLQLRERGDISRDEMRRHLIDNKIMELNPNETFNDPENTEGHETEN